MAHHRDDWFTSSYTQQNGACVEARFTAMGIDVRDSKDPSGYCVKLSDSTWTRFVAEVRKGHVEP